MAYKNRAKLRWTFHPTLTDQKNSISKNQIAGQYFRFNLYNKALPFFKVGGRALSGITMFITLL